ncbi:ATP-binding cassette sub-family C member 2-like isoform X2 [Haemaphysalis longicornis]
MGNRVEMAGNTQNAIEVAAQLLKVGTLIVLLVFGSHQADQNNYPVFSHGPYWTLLDIVQFALLILAAASGVVQGYLTLADGRVADAVSSPVLVAATCDFCMALSFGILLHLIWKRCRRCLPPSGFACAMLGFLTAAAVFDAFYDCTTLQPITQEITFTNLSFQSDVLLITFLLAACTAGNFFMSGIRDLVLLKRNRSKVSWRFLDNDSVSVLGRLTCTTLLPLFHDILTKSKSRTQIPILRRGVRSQLLVEAFTSRLSNRNRKAKSQSPKWSFVANLTRVMWIDALRVLLCLFAYFACIFARISALELMITSVGGAGMATASLLFTTACIGEWLMSSYYMDLLGVIGSRTRALLQGVVFQKATMLSSTATEPTGYVASLLGVDCNQLCVSIYSMPLTFCGVTTMPLLFWMLAQRAGVGPALCCAAWVVLTLVMPLVSAPLQKRFWRRNIKARDERLKYMSDLLSTVRVVKMYAWEDALGENALRSRDVELKWLFRANVLDAVLDSLYGSCSAVLMIILFSTMDLFGHQVVLSPALSFTCISLLYVVDLTTNSISEVFRTASKATVALRRIAAFCSAEEIDEKKRDQGAEFGKRKGEVKMEKCSFTWARQTNGIKEPQLQNVTLQVDPGSLIGIVGFVGCGKSSLLSAILGDMKRVQGTSMSVGRIAYVPQLPNVHNMTIRDNITYGRAMHPANYERVLRSCQLLNDLSKMPAGDMAEIGEKTRIMVCSQGIYLRHMDKIVLVHAKGAKVYGSLQELLKDPASPQNFRLALKENLLEPKAEDCTGGDMVNDSDAAGQITEEELAESTKSGWQLLCALVRFSEWPALAAVAVLMVSAAASAWEQLWIKGWTDASTEDAVLTAEQRSFWIGGLVGLCLVDVLCRVAGGVLLAATARRLSRSLQESMLGGVLRSPVSFFDSSPRGRVLNRFTSDIDFVDAECFVSGKQSVQGVLLTAARVAVVGTQVPTVVLITVVVAIIFAWGINLSSRASHISRFYDRTASSRLFQHMTETLDALSSVRAYGVVQRFRSHFFRLSDTCLRGYGAFCTCYLFTHAISATGAFVVVMSTLLVNTTGSSLPSASSLGVALSSATSVPLALMTLCVMMFNTLQMLVSFERCLEYAELPPETDVETGSGDEKRALDDDCAKSWPSEGRIEFEKYRASYRPGVTPDVLINVTFTVEPMNKVGIVGRTGAGKSSFVLAMLRMLRASEGRILIDGLDIASVPLKKLRRSITVIPQDPSLVRGTLRLNLDPTCSHSDEELWRALRQAHLADVVTEHAAGLELETADGGANLSVGQRQLVCLARALLRGSKILLLDEATSQMDGDTDRLIQITLREAFAQCTLLTIAHRVHTVLDYDRILVLGEGKVKEYGSPAALLSNPDSAFYKMAADAGIAVDAAIKRAPEVTSL